MILNEEVERQAESVFIILFSSDKIRGFGLERIDDPISSQISLSTE
jgi:hypothetical protein